MRFPLLLAAAAVLTLPAGAVTVQVRTTNFVSGQGYISPFANARGGADPAQLIEERFNSSATLGTCARQRPALFKFGPNGSDDPTSRSAPPNGIAAATGRDPNHRLPPGTNGAFADANPPSADIDQSCYAFGPNYNQFLPSNGILQPYRLGFTRTGATYLGFYLGSIDQYNTFTLYSKDSAGQLNNNPLIINGLNPNGDGSFNGIDLTTFLNVPIYSSQFVEFFFAPGEKLDHIDFGSNGAALEFDNLAYTTIAVSPTGTYANPNGTRGRALRSFAALATPEPLAGAVLASGLAMLALARRRARA